MNKERFLNIFRNIDERHLMSQRRLRHMIDTSVEDHVWRKNRDRVLLYSLTHKSLSGGREAFVDFREQVRKEIDEYMAALDSAISLVDHAIRECNARTTE